MTIKVRADRHPWDVDNHDEDRDEERFLRFIAIERQAWTIICRLMAPYIRDGVFDWDTVPPALQDEVRQIHVNRLDALRQLFDY